MKKYLLLLSALCMLGFGLSAQGTIHMTTSAEIGTKVKLLPNVVSATVPLTIDAGDGVEQKFTVDPSLSAWQRWIEIEVKGDHITIGGYVTEFTLNEASITSVTVSGMNKLTELDLSKNLIESFELQTPTPLKELNLSYNSIYNSPTDNPKLSLDQCASDLTNLYLAHNTALQCLDIRDLTVLEYLSVNDSPEFASLFICMPEEARPMLRSINIDNCALSHFYPVSLPGLRVLSLANNHLMSDYDDSPFELGNYPELRSLSVGGNRGIHNLDVSSCPLMETLLVNDCSLSTLDLSSLTELRSLNIANNKIATIDLSVNKQLGSLTVNGNPLSELSICTDASFVPTINNLNISDTNISRLDLLKWYFLKQLKASNTKLEFLDFNGMQPSRMTLIDLRNNPNFTYESMAYTVRTLPICGRTNASEPNLLLEGSNAEKADIDFATGADLQWKCDIEGDGSATWDELNVTLVGATATGERKTGVVDRLYPYAGYSMPYDLEVMHVDGGDFVIAQWEPSWFQTIKSVTDGKALKGVPMYVYAYPEEGKRFKSVTINGKECKSPWFIVSEDAQIKVNFTGAMQSIALTVPSGQEMSFLINTTENNGTVWVDWGNGGRAEYPGQTGYTTGSSELGGTRIDGRSAGTTVTIYGNIAGLDASGWGDVAEWMGLWDNAISAIDLSNAPDLKSLNVHWNPISTLDLSNNPLLEVLDAGYSLIKVLDLANCPNLMSLSCYSDGYGDEEEGIAQLTAVDVTKLPILQELILKNNLIENIDLSQNPYLRWLDLGGNKIASIDLSANTMLEEANLSRNLLTSIDLAANTELVDLSLDSNKLTTVDLTNNLKLVRLMMAGNNLDYVNLKHLADLKTLYINDNGLTADKLNDIFYTLPQRKPDEDNANQNGTQLSWNLCLFQGTDANPNDYYGNDGSIALDRGWTPSHQGMNNSCDVAYLDLISSTNGTYTVTDAAGNVYGHGSKVPKYIPLTINAVPAEGYAFYAYTLNNDEPVLGAKTFDMPGIYTKLRVSFVRGSGIDGTDVAAPTVRPVASGIAVEAADALVSVYSAAGALVASERVDGSAVIALAPAFYIVKIDSADGNTVTSTVAVR